MKVLFKWTILLVLVLVISGCGASSDEATGSSEAKNIELRFVSAAPGGGWHALATAIGELLQKEIDGLTVSVEPGGSTSNAQAIHQGSGDIGLVFSTDAVAGIRGEEPFEEELASLRDVGKLTLMSQHFITPRDSGIEKVEELRGRNFATLTVGTGGELTTRLVLEQYGITYDDMNVQHGSSGDLINYLQDRHVEVIGATTSIPASIVTEPGAMRDMRVLDLSSEVIDKLVEINPGYRPHVIAAGTYAGQGNPEEVKTITSSTRLIARQDLPEDLIYQITKVLVENTEHLSVVAPELADFEAQDFAESIGIPFHDGAIKLFEEKGVSIQ